MQSTRPMLVLRMVLILSASVTKPRMDFLHLEKEAQIASRPCNTSNSVKDLAPSNVSRKNQILVQL
jgi:hypothetical protein